MRPPRTLIVSEVMLFRQGLQRALEQIGTLEIIGALKQADAASAIREQRVELIILDASRRRDLASAAALRAAFPDLKIIAFGIGSAQDMLIGAESGISAFVDQHGDAADIARAALMAMEGECYCSPRDTARLIDHIAQLARQEAEPIEGQLTLREREVAERVGRGLSNKEIALQLRISPATVKNHVHNILEKFQLPSRSAIGTRIQPDRIQAWG